MAGKIKQVTYPTGSYGFAYDNMSVDRELSAVFGSCRNAAPIGGWSSWWTIGWQQL